jgi:hypothetical protein
VSFSRNKNTPEAQTVGEASGVARRTLYEIYESVPRTQGHRQLQAADFVRFPLRQLPEHLAHARDRGRLADLNYLGHVLTSMSEL